MCVCLCAGSMDVCLSEDGYVCDFAFKGGKSGLMKIEGWFDWNYIHFSNVQYSCNVTQTLYRYLLRTLWSRPDKFPDREIPPRQMAT